jgi:hypothetical protein
MWTVWITVLVAFNRYVAICLPFQATSLCRMSHVRIQVVFSAIIICLYNVPRFLEHRLQPAMTSLTDHDSPEGPATDGYGNFTADPYVDEQLVAFPLAVETSLKTNLAYNIAYENVLYCFFVFLGPLVILVILNACLIRELCHARRRLRERHLPASLSGPEQGEQNLTLVMIVIVVIFVICQTPAFVNQLMFVIGVEDTCGRAYFYYYHLSNLLITTNSAVNFVVYCVFRRHFRRRLRAYFCRCGGKRAAARRGSDGSLLQQWPTDQTCDHYIGLRTASMCNSVGGGTATGGRKSMVSVHRVSTTQAPAGKATTDIELSAVIRTDAATNSHKKRIVHLFGRF